MSSVLGSSQSLVLATTAMVVSSTVLFLAFSRKNSQENSQPTKPILRSCLCSDEKGRRMEKKDKKKKKKKVKFADDVKEPKSNGEEFRKRYNKNYLVDCRRQNEVVYNGMPANRVALYSGILRDRVNRMECSY